jgi:hypothetical protein
VQSCPADEMYANRKKWVPQADSGRRFESGLRNRALEKFPGSMRYTCQTTVYKRLHLTEMKDLAGANVIEIMARRCNQKILLISHLKVRYRRDNLIPKITVV